MLVFHVDAVHADEREMGVLEFAVQQEVEGRGLADHILLTRFGSSLHFQPRQRPLDQRTVLVLVESAKTRILQDWPECRIHDLRIYGRKERGYPSRGSLLLSKGWSPEGRKAEQEARRTGKCAICAYPLRSPSVMGSLWKPYHQKTPLTLRVKGLPDCSDLYYERYWRSWGTAKRACLRASGGKCAKCGKAADPALVKKGLTSMDPSIPGFEFDHITEIALGGDPLDPANLQFLCKACHLDKTRAFLSASQRKMQSAPVGIHAKAKGSVAVPGAGAG